MPDAGTTRAVPVAKLPRPEAASVTTILLCCNPHYNGLFATAHGLDRISCANRVTTGVTTRIYDDAAVERFNVSVGQICYFTESHRR